jgi:NhaP-type Na+/H+ or K+/H+ antiporter
MGYLGEWIFEKTNIPDVLWLMLLGLIINYFFGTAKSQIFSEIAPLFTVFALLFILFEGVLNIDLKKLISGIIEGTSLSFLNFIFSMFAVAAVLMIFGWNFWEGMLLGAMLGDASQAIIIPLIKKIKMKQETAIILTFESAISDVFCIVGTLTILHIIRMRTFNFSIIYQEVLYSIFAAIVLGIIIAFLWIKIHGMIEMFSKSYITTIAVLLLLYSLTEYVHASGVLACFIFGIVIGHSNEIYGFLKKDNSYSLENSARFFFSEISFFLKTFFFVYMGMIIDFKSPLIFLYGILLTFLLFLVRPLAVLISHRKIDTEDKDKTYLEVLNPKGLSAAVLAQLPIQYGLAHGLMFSTLVTSVIITSTIICVVAVFLTERGKFKGFWKIFSNDSDYIDEALLKETNR